MSALSSSFPTNSISAFTVSGTLTAKGVLTQATLTPGGSAGPTYLATDTSTPPRVFTAISTASIPSGQSNGSDAIQTIGVILGVVIGVCFLLCCVVFLWWMRRNDRIKKKQVNKHSHSHQPKPSQKHAKRPSDSSQKPKNPKRTNQQREWPRRIAFEEIGVAVTSSRRRNFVGKLTNAQHIRTPILPTAAPIRQDQTSAHASSRGRFFIPPPPIPKEDPNRHIGDTTTIRTSANSPTPNQLALNVLRPLSTASAATSFEDDGEYRPIEIDPPLTFNTRCIPTRPMSSKRAQSGSRKLTLEVGILKNANKAISDLPTTPRYDNGYGEQSNRSKSSLAPKAVHKPVESDSAPRSRLPKTSSARSVPPKQPLEPHFELPPIPHTPSLPLSILRKGGLHNDRGRHLRDHRGEITDVEAVRPPPLAIRKTNDPSTTNPLRNLRYPHVPASASEHRFTQRVAGARTGFGTGMAPRPGPAQNTEWYATRPLSSVESVSNHQIIPPNTSRAGRKSRPPARIDVPIASQDNIRLYPSSGFSSSNVMLTPNRTSAGDLILTVDM